MTDRLRLNSGARLDPAELAVEIGPLTVPPPLPTPATEQVAAD